MRVGGSIKSPWGSTKSGESEDFIAPSVCGYTTVSFSAPQTCALERFAGLIPESGTTSNGTGGELVGHVMGNDRTYQDIFKSFALLGWIGFGGPAAHIALFEKEFVEKKKWMSQSVFLELLALGQCIPGPTSTQMSFAMGVIQKGIPGGLLSGILFQYPGFMIMSVVGLGSARFLLNPSDALRGIVAGLSAAGVALVVDAGWGLGNKICTDEITKLVCIFSAATAYYTAKTFVELKALVLPLLILWGGILTLVVNKKKPAAITTNVEAKMLQSMGLSINTGLILIGIWLAVLIVVIVLRNTVEYSSAPAIHWFEAFYRTGSLIFGGGQVVLPLLLGEVDTWMTEEQFYAGLGVVQVIYPILTSFLNERPLDMRCPGPSST
ncbi:hypothetical protein CYMTET_34936 [Cymbomonas tetramitiformis]|uniref:Chromate transporter n=1 Tax=Cymbomonas tetramitiformis TaxID=36881 RepID=A0AAE0FAN4_9CHLO|nr:hypothetical protein CYMTET_34936 [Cymbomonas tetramitiformis]